MHRHIGFAHRHAPKRPNAQPIRQHLPTPLQPVCESAIFRRTLPSRGCIPFFVKPLPRGPSTENAVTPADIDRTQFELAGYTWAKSPAVHLSMRVARSGVGIS